MDASKKDCCKQKSDCDELMLERMHYFMGRHLTARDFTDEQAYHRSHRLFHNRMLHGWGVVCGLNVRQHPQAECHDRYVEVSPGIALDCCGQELIVECCASCVAQKLPEIPWKDYKETHPLLLLCLSYEECKIDPVPVLHNEGDCSNAKTECGRYLEGWKLCWHWIAKSELTKYRWDNQYGECPPDQPPCGQTNPPPPGQSSPTSQQQGAPAKIGHPQVAHGEPCCKDDCGDPCGEGYHSCVEPNCPPGHCVPIALICAKPGQPVLDNQILLRGRPELPYGPQRLTHIVQINWPHGGIISPAWFRDHDGRLTLKFDRKLQPQRESGYPGPSGVNEATFVVQVGELYEDLDFVPFCEPPHLLGSGCEAEYHVESRKFHHEHYDFLEDHTLWITVKCDFLYDCHGVRVDGNNDGVAGGTFESWVSVVSEEKYEQLKKEGKL